MRIPLVRPNMPKLAEVQEYFQLAEKHGQYSNFGLCYDIAVTKLQKVYPGSYPVLVNNGTTAIQVALQATLPRGSRVALPTFTFTATLNAVVAAGMVPVLFDVDPNTWQIDPVLLGDYKGRIDGIIVVSPFGYSVNIGLYDNISELMGVPVIYDFAPAWGHPISKDNPTTFSFHATKTLPIGEGGAVMLPNNTLQAKAKQLINFDFWNQNPQSEFGMNGKMDELHCAVLCAQLDRNNELVEATQISQYVVDELRAHLGTKSSPMGSGFLQIPVISIFNDKFKVVVKHLESSGIASKPYYKPRLHEAFPDIEFVHGSEIIAPDNTLGIARPQDYNEADIIIHKILQAVRK
jgi:dTDP-4-amino-4,6-dideoxygalactose transaminase